MNGEAKATWPAGIKRPMKGNNGIGTCESSQLVMKVLRDVPAPVTRATLPSREAAANPKGPGIWSYLLVVVVRVAAGIVDGRYAWD